MKGRNLRISHVFQVVDTSQLIKNEQEILKTPKVACFWKNGLLYERIENSPAKSILGMIYEKTRLKPEMEKERQMLGDRCLLSLDLKMLKLAISKDVFLLGEQDAANLLFSAAYLVRGVFTKAWILESGIHPHNLVCIK